MYKNYERIRKLKKENSIYSSMSLDMLASKSQLALYINNLYNYVKYELFFFIMSDMKQWKKYFSFCRFTSGMKSMETVLMDER